jgi:hypothetical protein
MTAPCGKGVNALGAAISDESPLHQDFLFAGRGFACVPAYALCSVQPSGGRCNSGGPRNKKAVHLVKSVHSAIWKIEPCQPVETIQGLDEQISVKEDAYLA